MHTATHSTTLDASSQGPYQGATRAVSISLVFRSSAGRELISLDDKLSIVVGRAASCDVRIEDPSLSRRHARFVREGDTLRIEDLGSRNGVVLREQRVERATLRSGDWAALGNVVVSVHTLSNEPSAKPASSQSGSYAVEPCAATLWVGERMQEVQRLVQRVAATQLPVLVRGETGTGKELIAQELHRLSRRARAKLQVVNCAAIPATLLDSVLFGHERGAYTGAERARSGVFEQAHGGTVFLDEVGELPADAQAALLRVLETGRFTRLGGSQEIEVDVRLIAATHRNLEQMVSEGQFRLDLLHRLDVVNVTLPALRERPEQLPVLIEHFSSVASQQSGLPPKHFDAQAMLCLERYDWPGNVRELRNVVERSFAVADGESIRQADLPERLRPAGLGASTLPPAPRSPSEVGTLRSEHESRERALLIDTLAQAGGNRRLAASTLGVSLRTLERRLSKYGMNRAKE